LEVVLQTGNIVEDGSFVILANLKTSRLKDLLIARGQVELLIVLGQLLKISA